MKTLELAETTLGRCVAEASSDQVILTRNGKAALLVSHVEGLDQEQIDLGTSAKCWKMIEE